MTAHERRVWKLIYPEYTDENNMFGDVDDLTAAVAKDNAAGIPEPDCNKCFGRGTRGSVVCAKYATGRLNPDGSQQPQPITYADWQEGRIKKSPIFCKCIRRTLNTIKRLAKEHDELIRPSESD